jgi:hypothetical protein
MSPELAALIAEQGGVVTRAQALRWETRQDVDRWIREGTWVLVQRSVYATRERAEAARTPAQQHLLAALARCVVTTGDTVVSHGSAATILGIPQRRTLVGPPRLTVHVPASTTAGGIRGRYLAPVPAEHRILVDGVPLTSGARTVADLCRTRDERSAVVVADAGLRLGLSREEILAVLAYCRRWPYVADARMTISRASRWSESPLESLALRWCRIQGLPRPEQQLTIRTEGGRFLARVDLIWPELRTVAELDGQVKYAEDDDAQRPGRVAWREKLREDGIRDRGIEVARGYWSDDADDGARFAQRVRRAAARAASYTGAPTYRIVDERDHAQRGPLAA